MKKKTKTVKKGWLVLLHGEVDYGWEYPRIYLQKTKPKVALSFCNCPAEVVHCTLTFEV